MSIRPVLAALCAAIPPVLASCAPAPAGDSAASSPAAALAQGPSADEAWTIAEVARLDEPWAARFLPGTDLLFVTEKRGAARIVDTAGGPARAVGGLPAVDYGGQGGLGDVAFLEAEAAATPGRRTIYLSWVEAGPAGTRGAVVGRGVLACPDTPGAPCRIEALGVIWRQAPKLSGRGHFSHRIAIAPDGSHLFVSSGERQAFTPAQDTANNLGSIVRLNLDGTPAQGNPLAGQAGKAADIWSWGHRNVLGLHFDAQGRLWGLEHGPDGGDELNLIRAGANYGWPLVSDGDHYDGKPIPRNATRPDLAQPAISWNPVIAPGDFVVYSGKQNPRWQGQVIIAGLGSQGLVRVAIAGETAREVARIPLDSRIREVTEGPDGTLWILEDGKDARLLRMRFAMPASPAE